MRHGPDCCRWSFVIDTDEYAGNFEREMCAYVTGQVENEDDRRMLPYIERFEREMPGDPFAELITWRLYDPGDDGYLRTPVNIAVGPNNDFPFNSVQIHLDHRPTEQELLALVERAKEFSTLPKLKEWDRRPRILGCRLVCEHTVIDTKWSVP